MVSFACNNCGDIVKKPKLDQHRRSCGGSFTCIDCHTTFVGETYKAHTNCISEAEKYQGKLYRGEKKGQQKQNGAAKAADPKVKPEEKKAEAKPEEKKADSKPAAKPEEKKEDAMEVEVEEKKTNGKDKKEKKEDKKSEKKRKRDEKETSDEERPSKRTKKEKKDKTDTKEASQNGDAEDSSSKDPTASVVDLQALKWRKIICKVLKHHGGSADYETIKSEVVDSLKAQIASELPSLLNAVFDEKVVASKKVTVEDGKVSMSKSRAKT